MGRRPLVIVSCVLAGCGGGEDQSRPAERGPQRADAPAEPPRGWRTLENERAGFTIAVPRRWTARTRERATLIRSPDRLLVLTIAADRGPEGRETPPAEYATETLESLGLLQPDSGEPVPGSPYESARAEATGPVPTTERLQRVVVAAFHLPGRATYAAVAFRNASRRPRAHERTLERMLATLRAGPAAPGGAG